MVTNLKLAFTNVPFRQNSDCAIVKKYQKVYIS